MGVSGISQQQAITWCCQIEGRIHPHRWHVGLTGGTLYKTGRRKDVDFILYPHVVNNQVVRTQREILKIVSILADTLGFKASDITPSAHYKDGKKLFKVGAHFDVFVFGT